MAPKSENILEIDDLRLRYSSKDGDVFALSGASMTISAGEGVGIVGESGSGKSTLVKAVMGLLPERKAIISHGRILLDGRDITALRAREWDKVRGNPIAMVFQDPLGSLNPVMKIGTQIGESVWRHDPEANLAQRIEELLTLVRLKPSVAKSYPHELSGGMRQRALLAVALGCRPRLLIADEPTTALDVTTQAEIMELLTSLRHQLGMALLLISHDLGTIRDACDRLYVMYGGRTVESGPTETAFRTPAHPYTIGLLKAALGRRNADGRFSTIQGDVPNLTQPPKGCPFRTRCDFVMPECEEMPEPISLSNVSHSVRCWWRQKQLRGRSMQESANAH